MKKRSLREFSEEFGVPPIGGLSRQKLKQRSDGWTVFGFVADTHLGSRHYRADVLNSLYDWYAEAGVGAVYHGGNWVDGVAPFNKHDLVVHGMEDQIKHFLEHYPKRKGITTYIVSGDDHEGWWVQRESVNIGRMLQARAVDAGRHDIKHLGYLEADVELKHGSGSAVMKIMHGGGGSAYAVSYRPQKIVESFTGGEKPQVLLLGHYHKLSYNMTRNVHVVQGGCTQDQTIFMRKKSIEAHVGGVLIYLRQDKRGSITDFIPHFRTFFDRGYYERRYE